MPAESEGRRGSGRAARAGAEGPAPREPQYPTRLRISAPAEVALPKPELKIADATSWTEAQSSFRFRSPQSKPGAFAIDVDFKSAGVHERPACRCAKK